MNRVHGVIAIGNVSRLSAFLAGASGSMQDLMEEKCLIARFVRGRAVLGSEWTSSITTRSDLSGHTIVGKFFKEEWGGFTGTDVCDVLSATWLQMGSGVSFHVTLRDTGTFYFLLVGGAATKEHLEIFERHVDPAHERSMCWPNPTIEGVGNIAGLDAGLGHVLIAARSVPAREKYVGGPLGRFRFVDEKWP